MGDGQTEEHAFSMSAAQQRLFDVGQVPPKRADAFLKAVTPSPDVDTKEALYVWKKWAFGESVATLTEVRHYADGALLRNWVFSYDQVGDETRLKMSSKKVDRVVSARLENFARGLFSEPLPLDMGSSGTYTSSSGVDLFIECANFDKQLPGWAIRKRAWLSKEDFKRYIDETRGMVRLTGIPSL